MQSEQCLTCKWKVPGVPICAAFPYEDEGGIPDAIYTGLHDHREPYPGDHGFRWELDPSYEGVVDEEAP